jgi:hypothetical protein
LSVDQDIEGNAVRIAVKEVVHECGELVSAQS